MEVVGTVTGLGNSATRKNEITADNVAIFRNCVYNGNEQAKQNATGVFGENAFDLTIENNAVIVAPGFCMAYGYLGCSDTVKLLFNITAAPQYWIIYAEFNCSVIPNTFAIKARNNQSLSKVNEYSMRQDNLAKLRTGVFQMPLAVVKVDGEEVTLVSDERVFALYPYKAYAADETLCITGEIEDGAVIVPPIEDGDHPCTTQIAVLLIRNAIQL